jgi:diacylglycerol kinase
MSFLNERSRSFKYAFAGIIHTFRTQPNVWIHALAMIIVVFAGFLLKISLIEWTLVIIAIGVVITTEILNTAIEKLVDLVSPERQEKAGIVKDLSAAAVLIASFMALIIGCIIFIPKILHVFLTRTF